MGTSFVKINECGFWMLDSVLELWLRLLALHIEDPMEPGSVASKIRDQWLLASRGSYNGCIPICLDEDIATEDGKQIVRAAILSLLKALVQSPLTLGKDTLNLLGIDGNIGRDIETMRLIEVGRAFLELIDGKITSTARDTSFMPGCQ